MEKSIKGTQTEQNLLKSYVGECQARNRYSIFSKIAKKEGYEQIAEIFLETSNQEYSHAKQFFRLLEGGNIEITASYPAGVEGTTIENLKAAIEGENEEWTSLYLNFAEIAEAEGFKKIAVLWKLVSEVEKVHEERFQKLLERVESGEVFKREEEADWICRVCGLVHHGKNAPKICPLCNHPQAYFEEMNTSY